MAPEINLVLKSKRISSKDDTYDLVSLALNIILKDLQMLWVRTQIIKKRKRKKSPKVLLLKEHLPFRYMFIDQTSTNHMPDTMLTSEDRWRWGRQSWSLSWRAQHLLVKTGIQIHNLKFFIEGQNKLLLLGRRELNCLGKA